MYSLAALDCGALELFQSYLPYRTVRPGDYVSPPQCLRSGVPQISTKGPLMFIFYTSQFVKML